MSIMSFFSLCSSLVRSRSNSRWAFVSERWCWRRRSAGVTVRPKRVSCDGMKRGWAINLATTYDEIHGGGWEQGAALSSWQSWISPKLVRTAHCLRAMFLISSQWSVNARHPFVLSIFRPISMVVALYVPTTTRAPRPLFHSNVAPLKVVKSPVFRLIMRQAALSATNHSVQSVYLLREPLSCVFIHPVLAIATQKPTIVHLNLSTPSLPRVNLLQSSRNRHDSVARSHQLTPRNCFSGGRWKWWRCAIERFVVIPKTKQLPCPQTKGYTSKFISKTQIRYSGFERYVTFKDSVLFNYSNRSRMWSLGEPWIFSSTNSV